MTRSVRKLFSYRLPDLSKFEGKFFNESVRLPYMSVYIQNGRKSMYFMENLSNLTRR